MKVAILLLATLAFAAAASVPQLRAEEYEFLFTSWMKEHGKTYEAAEAVHRFNIWKSNLDVIRTHNADTTKSYKVAMNKFGDLTNEEFRSQYNNFVPTVDNSFLRTRNLANLSKLGLPDSVDWNAAGKLTPVKDQGQCGSCWSFSATGALECAYAIASGSVISLSEQELVDCSTAQGNQGCNGGLMDQAFQFVISNSGLCSEGDYPYTASQGTCQTTCTSQVTISGFQDVTANSEDALQAAVAQTAVSVAVDAGGYSWQFYSSGVMTGDCGTDLDHGVLAAGYGTLNGTPYWYVKNSWGSGWGQSGYVLLQRSTGSGNAGMCGITLAASYPTGATHA